MVSVVSEDSFPRYKFDHVVCCCCRKTGGNSSSLGDMVTGSWRTTPPSAGECKYYQSVFYWCWNKKKNTFLSAVFYHFSFIDCYFLIFTSQTEAKTGRFWYFVMIKHLLIIHSFWSLTLRDIIRVSAGFKTFKISITKVLNIFSCLS